jgi:hypothetical protein
MSATIRRTAIMVAFAMLVPLFGSQPQARADDNTAAAIAAGLITGALVYEAFDNDGYCWNYGPPYYRTRYVYPRPVRTYRSAYRVVRVWCPICYAYRPRTHTHYYYGYRKWYPRVSYRTPYRPVYRTVYRPPHRPVYRAPYRPVYRTVSAHPQPRPGRYYAPPRGDKHYPTVRAHKPDRPRDDRPLPPRNGKRTPPRRYAKD